MFKKLFLQQNKLLIMDKLIFIIIREKMECSNAYFSNWIPQLDFYPLVLIILIPITKLFPTPYKFINKHIG
jgi:hypothetical protein